MFKRVFFSSSIESIELKVLIICNVFQCSEKKCSLGHDLIHRELFASLKVTFKTRLQPDLNASLLKLRPNSCSVYCLSDGRCLRKHKLYTNMGSVYFYLLI